MDWGIGLTLYLSSLCVVTGRSSVRWVLTTHAAEWNVVVVVVVVVGGWGGGDDAKVLVEHEGGHHPVWVGGDAKVR